MCQLCHVVQSDPYYLLLKATTDESVKHVPDHLIFLFLGGGLHKKHFCGSLEQSVQVWSRVMELY